jgi:RNA polymerase-binding protein DksA
MAQPRARRVVSARLQPGDPTSAAVRASMTARTRAAAEAEEADGEGEASDTSSLLAGPRNVKPYVAKRGEQYMSKQQLAHFQLILLNWKRDLMEEVDRTVSHMKDEAANFPDPNDRATQEEEFSLELRTRDRERKLIRKIDEALKRIEDGTYGYCLETGEEIGIKRLEARPGGDAVDRSPGTARTPRAPVRRSRRPLPLTRPIVPATLHAWPGRPPSRSIWRRSRWRPAGARFSLYPPNIGFGFGFRPRLYYGMPCAWL